MSTTLWVVVIVALGLPALVLVFHTLARVVRKVHKFPMPACMAGIIDNRFRRRIQPVEETVRRHGVEPGMTVLEVGPGNGTYTLAAARRVGPQAKVVALDIQPKILERLRRRAREEGIENIDAILADVHDLPFDDESFDAIYLIFVIGEMPEAEAAMKEFHRVLSPSGTIAFSEILVDPDYSRRRTLIRMATGAGFRLKRTFGNFFLYTLVFEKEA